MSFSMAMAFSAAACAPSTKHAVSGSPASSHARAGKVDAHHLGDAARIIPIALVYLALRTAFVCRVSMQMAGKPRPLAH